MDSQAFLMKVRQGKYQAYKDAHDQLWPEIKQQLSDHRIDIAIYYFEPFLFVMQWAPTAETWIKHGSTPVAQRWNKKMMELLEVNEEGNIKIFPVEKTFTFGFFKQEEFSE